MKDFKQEFQKFKNKILNKENFSLLRYGDGEIYLMRKQAIGHGTQAYIMDGWYCDAKEYKLGNDLIEAAQINDTRMFYGIPSPSQRWGEYLYMKDFIKVSENNITFADIWVNSNYAEFKKFITEELKDPVIIIANEEVEKNIQDGKLGPLSVFDFFGVPNDCANFYETNSLDMQNKLNKYINIYNSVFFISAGPMAEAIILYLFKNNPNNIYIDIGSALDEIGKLRITRGYVSPNDSHTSYTPTWN